MCAALIPHPSNERYNTDQVRSQRAQGIRIDGGEKFSINSIAGQQITKTQRRQRADFTHRSLAIFCFTNVVQDHILNENSHRFKDEGHKQMNVNVVSGAVQLPAM